MFRINTFLSSMAAHSMIQPAQCKAKVGRLTAFLGPVGKHILQSHLCLVSNAWRTCLKAWTFGSNRIVWSYVQNRIMAWHALSLFRETFFDPCWTMIGYLIWHRTLLWPFNFLQDLLQHVYPVYFLLSSPPYTKSRFCALEPALVLSTSQW